MFDELKNRLDDRSKTPPKNEDKSKTQYFRIENTIFKMPQNVSRLGVSKTRQLIKAVRARAPYLSHIEALKDSEETIKENDQIPINYKDEIIQSIHALLELSSSELDVIMESDEEIREATIQDLIDI